MINYHHNQTPHEKPHYLQLYNAIETTYATV